MKSPATNHTHQRRISRCLVGIILFLMATELCLARPDTQRTNQSAAQDISTQSVDRLLSIAEAQFEMVKILIQQDRFDRVLPEMNVIFNLGLPEKFEEAVAESAGIVGNLLLAKRQYDLGRQVLDEAFLRMRRNDNRAAILKIQAYIYREEGKLDQAMECLAQAVELEKQHF